MAIKKNQTKTLQKTVTVLKEKATQLNEELLIASDELVEGSIATGERIQDIVAKVLKNGTMLLDKQQELAFDTIEAVIAQYKTGNMKFKSLLGFDKYTARKAKAKKSNIKLASKRKVATTKKAKATVVEVITTMAAEETTVVKKTRKPRTVAKKAKTVKKVTATKKPVVTRKSTTKKDDLTIIEGIGPKIAALLNKGGIKTFNQLAKADISKVKEILAKAGKRYNAHDPTTWGQQAELAAAGKWEVLQAWKNRMKGGKSSTNKRVVIV